MFYIVKNNVCKEYNYIRYGIRSFSKNRILGIGAISSLITFLSAVICFFILIVEFFFGGGTENFFNALSFHGNAGNFFHTPYLSILGCLNIITIVVSYISFFKNEKKKVRILGTIPFAIICICIVICFTALTMCEKGAIINSDQMTKIMYGSMLVGFISLIASLIILFIRERAISRSFLRTFLFSFFMLPLLTFCIENLIPLIALLLLIIGIKIFFSSEGSNNTNYKSQTQPQKAPETTNVQAKVQSNSAKEQAIYDINRRYNEGCAAILKAHGEDGAWMLSDETNREIIQLRETLKKEAILKGVEEEVCIYR